MKEIVTQPKEDPKPPLTDWALAENLVRWASLAYGCGFVIVLIQTSKLGIPAIQVLDPLNALVGTPVAVILLLWRLFIANPLRTGVAEIKGRLSAAAQLVEQLDSGQLEEKIEAIAARLANDRSNREWLKQAVRYAIRVNRINAVLAIPSSFYLVLCVLVLIFSYVQLIYPSLPQSLGGGKPAPICFLTTHEKLPDDARVKDLISINSRCLADAAVDKLYVPRVDAIYLLYLVGDAYYIRAGSPDSDSPVIEIERDAIGGVIYFRGVK